ncbi:disulfide isomerase [Burkholderia gladioli pv. gladioli]|nr:disulfide isomerase [Burkholderia gladioli pv. gladioli]AWY52681.1 disulfide isomerase [Burkholderia gladioli pv. gladioli]
MQAALLRRERTRRASATESPPEDFMKTRISIALAIAGLTIALTSRADDPPPPTLDAAQVARVQAAPAIVEGASGAKVKSTLYVFMDPNCIYCHLMWRALRPYEAAGLQVHWIPLAFLKPDSAGKAAALLKAPDGPALLNTLETKYSEKDESGGIAPLMVVPADAKAKLDANAAMFQQLGFTGTPTVVFRTKEGKWLGLNGLPRLSALPGILDMAEQPITDPELQRYR